MRGWWPLCPTMQALRPAPGESLCGAGSPYAPLCRRSALHPGDFPVAGKVTKGAPRAAPFGIPPPGFQQNFGNLTQSGSRDGTLALSDWKPQPSLSALFALAYASRRAGFCHRKRPICHFEMVGKPVFVVSFGFDQEKYSAVNPWRGRRLVARLGATFGGIRGIGEGVLRRRAGVLCSSVQFCAGFVQVLCSNKWLDYAIYRPTATKAQYFYKKIF